MKREKVIDAQGRRWVSGDLDPDTYFAAVRRRERAAAVRTVADRLASRTEPTGPRPPTSR